MSSRERYALVASGRPERMDGMNSDDLVAFLRARLDEDEAAARATEWCAGTKTFNGWDLYRVDEDDYEVRSRGATIARDIGPEIADHIARHDPERVLAEVEAKRRVLARHYAAPVPPGSEWAEAYPYCAAHAYEGPDGTVVYPVELKNCPELRDLAAPYADHPDYRPEWRP